MKKIKVLMVAGSMNVGGQENQIMNLLRYADKEKFQIDFTSTMKDAFYRSEIESLGGNFILVPEMNWKHPNVYCKALYEVMKKGQYDIVHSHELFHTGITLKIAKKAGVPIRIAHSHSGSDGNGNHRSAFRKIYNSVMRKLILRYSTVKVACSSTAGRFLFGEKATKDKNYHIIFNSVDTERFLKNYDNKNQLCKDKNWRSVLHVGHVIPIKNQEFLIEIAKVLKRTGRKIHIYCAGPGNEDYIDYLNNEIEKSQLSDYITLLGLRTDIPELMSEADAFVLPSKYEGMPLVMIEAQASGLPCVSADTYSPEVDFGIGSVTWLSLDKGAVVWAEALEKAVEKKRADKDTIEKVIKEKRFDSKMFAETVCDLYLQDYALRGRKND